MYFGVASPCRKCCSIVEKAVEINFPLSAAMGKASIA